MAKAQPETLKTWDRAVMIPVDKLVFCSWNANEMDDEHMAALIADIDEGGFDEPLQVIPQEDKYLVLGGEHRTRAMIASDQAEVPAVIRTDLAEKSRRDLILWSFRRNHLRGRVNEQKYARLEQELIDQHQMTVEGARRAMLVDDELIKRLKKAEKKAAKAAANAGAGDDDDDEPKPDKMDAAAREKLLSGLRTAEQEVLLQSADTVEHGYLFFTQGFRDQSHLVVDEPKHLHALVSRMVEACKNNSAKVAEFLTSAITTELTGWEDK